MFYVGLKYISLKFPHNWHEVYTHKLNMQTKMTYYSRTEQNNSTFLWFSFWKNFIIDPIVHI